MRYRDLAESERLASEAQKKSEGFPALEAEALNNLGFCAFMRMDFERADSLFHKVHDEISNELECLVADVGMMKICQRTAMNKEFYDYWNSALRRMKRIGDDKLIMDNDRIRQRFNYARSEFYITAAVYYYYLQQEGQSVEAINEIDVENDLKDDTAQLLYYQYMKGSGGMYEADTPDEVVVGEFDFLLDCLITSHESGYVYFEANASQAMAELLKRNHNFSLLSERRPAMMRIVNPEDLPQEELAVKYAENALRLFKKYGDPYQTAGTYRTLASCMNEQGRHEEALVFLSEALSYVNRHHEKYYHCHDINDRLKPYEPMSTHSIELLWINNDKVKTVPEWIARIREQLSVTYAALGLKPQSDYNRNIYLDILDYTRQDKELENRFSTLERESKQLTWMLSLVVLAFCMLVLLLILWSRHWRKRYTLYIDSLKNALEVSGKLADSLSLKGEDKPSPQLIVPYIQWMEENGARILSLNEECVLLEKEQYVHKQHLIENKRQNLLKKACLSIVTGITPYIDRVINEVYKLTSFNYLSDNDIKRSKFQYISELIDKINEYNDILALWIKMRQGSLNLKIENFDLQSLFDVVQKGRKNFETKRQTLEVLPTDAVIKADKALTLFMINTLAENARKYTPEGGHIRIYALEKEDCIEISVQDNGIGISPEEVQRILTEKVYDKNKGFGLMNCKGIIEKYRKTNAFFRVCSFHIESEMGKGSRFFFRLPKGVRRLLFLCMLFIPFSSSYAIQSHPTDSLLKEANYYANEVYHANLEGYYENALMYADSAFFCLNEYCLKYADVSLPLLALEGEGDAAELQWFASGFDTDYYSLLDVRNEVAVACLALGDWEAYRYNNNAYTSLYKQISVDKSLAGYCEKMEKSANNKVVAIILCGLVLAVLLLGYFFFYLRRLMTYRYNLEQMAAINRRIFSLDVTEVNDADELAPMLVADIYREVNELIPIDSLCLGIYEEGKHALCMACSNGEDEEMRQDAEFCFAHKETVWKSGERVKCFPLSLEMNDDKVCMGVLAVKCVYDTEREDERLMLELMAKTLALVVYNALELMAQKNLDIELARDEVRKVMREENQLHVQNQVLDNCLSTIKHETIYYPNKIKRIIDKLNEGNAGEEEDRLVETIKELITYYKEIFVILSSCAARQLDEITFRRGVVEAEELAKSAFRYMKRASRNFPYRVEWRMEVQPIRMTGDGIQLNYLLENLINEALLHEMEGMLELRIFGEADFARIEFVDRRRNFLQEELNQLFYPSLSRMKRTGEDVLVGTEYLICKQIIRDHDEFAGRRGCRINAQPAEGGGFMVWFTIPLR